MNISKILFATPAIALATVLACASLGRADPNPSKPAKAQPPRTQLIELSVTSEGFVPSEVKVLAGRPVKLVVTRKVGQTCATEIVIKDLGINKPLPLNQPVVIEFTPAKPGRIPFSCGMGMITGVIIVQ